MKKAITLILATVLTFGGVCANVAPVYAQPSSVRVILDGQTLTVPSDMPQPQIVDGRTMLPLRYAASALGFDVAFDNATSTAIMTRENIILRHTMFTNVVTVNGVEKQYDVGSQNQNDYMIMPLVMFLDATGVNGEWDDLTRTVTINTEVLPDVLSMTIPDTPPIIRVGESVTVVVTANATVTQVQLLEDDSTIVAQSSTSIPNNNGANTFIMTWQPENQGTTGFRTIKTVAGSASGFSDRAQTQELSILVEGVPIVGPEINNMSLQNSIITAGSDAKVILYTTDAVERVRLTNNQNGTTEEVTQYTTTSRERRFEISTRLLRTGSVRLTVEVAGEDGVYTDAQSTTVTVRNVSPYADDEVQVIQVSASPRRARPNSNVTISVLTTNATSSVSIIEEGTNEVKAETRSPDTSSALNNEKTWTFTIRIPSDSHGQTLNYYASAVNGSQIRDLRFSIIADADAGNPALRIEDIDHRISGIVDEQTPVTVYTSTSAVRVEIYDNPDRRGHALASSSSHSISSNSRAWYLEPVIQRTGRQHYYVFAYDNNDNEVQDSFHLNGTANNSWRDTTTNLITDVSIEGDESEFYYDDRVFAMVTTSDRVTQVWIEDSSGKRVAGTTSYTGSSTRRWHLPFYADYNRRSGFVRYYVYALADGREDERSFEIYVRY